MVPEGWPVVSLSASIRLAPLKFSTPKPTVSVPAPLTPKSLSLMTAKPPLGSKARPSALSLGKKPRVGKLASSSL
jgi:hypothetical protein